MSGINVSLELIKPLEQVAIERGESITSIVEKLIADFLRDQRHLFLMKEMDRFRSLHPGLRAQYEGTYIAMRDGHVLDHDVDGNQLYARVRERLGDTPVLIVEVTDQPEQLFTRTSQRIAS
ncbi:MAG TPA: DUF5678 domain-containing protein [Promineifilum sp.]|nr:DUF5678 domain-containing protein [Promineifilum sp.]HRO92173.1 DUF5678 domain-containing protein [Promineifilum sp.]HRQ13151.1 DUF5678 domain-containing protein [Promineifilum sp.]